jgi:hypothetical protein
MQIMHLRIKYLIICTVIEDAHTCLGFFYSVPFGAVRLNKYKRYQFLKSYTTERGVCGVYSTYYTAIGIIYPMISSHHKAWNNKMKSQYLGSSTCNTDRKKTKREGSEEATGAVSAEGRGEEVLLRDDSKNSWPLSLYSPDAIIGQVFNVLRVGGGGAGEQFVISISLRILEWTG